MPLGPFELVKARPWATVYRIPHTHGVAYFKACSPVQAFEPQLSAALAARWPDRVGEVLAHDAARAWLLTADAGTPIADLGNPPERWLDVLPRYAELQRGEAAHAGEHLASGVPDLRPAVLSERFEDLLRADLPIDADEVRELHALAPNLAALASELQGGSIPSSVDHADLHLRRVFVADAAGRRPRILDWGDASIGHPFVSLVVTFGVLRGSNGLADDDPWFARLRDAYLEPWGSGLRPLFATAQRVGAVSQALGWLRHHRAMGTGAFPGFDEQFPGVLRTAIRELRTTLSA